MQPTKNATSNLQSVASHQKNSAFAPGRSAKAPGAEPALCTVVRRVGVHFSLSGPNTWTKHAKICIWLFVMFAGNDVNPYRVCKLQLGFVSPYMLLLNLCSVVFQTTCCLRVINFISMCFGSASCFVVDMSSNAGFSRSTGRGTDPTTGHKAFQ